MQKLIFFGLLISLLISGCDFIKKVNPFASHEDAMEEYQQQEDSLRRAELLIKQREEALSEQAIADSIHKVREAKIQPESEPESTRVLNQYHLIVGAFKTPSYARDYNEKIIAQGYDSKIIQSDNNFNLVTIKSFDNYRKAVDELEIISNEGEHLVWLHINESSSSISSISSSSISSISSSSTSSISSSSTPSTSSSSTPSTSSSVSSTSSTGNSGSENWNSILDSYEEYVDQYIKLMKKANAGDMSAMTEYLSMMEKAVEFADKLENASDDLTTAQLQRFNRMQMKFLNEVGDL